jgi:hypothetical protein
MGITNLEQDIRNKTTEELLIEMGELQLQKRTDSEEYKLIKKEISKRGEEV